RAPPMARVTSPPPLSSTVAWLRAEPAARGMLSADDQVNRALLARRAARPGQKELARSDVAGGDLMGRRAHTSTDGPEGKLRQRTVAWKDGGTYFTLEAEAPEAQAGLASREL